MFDPGVACALDACHQISRAKVGKGGRTVGPAFLFRARCPFVSMLFTPAFRRDSLLETRDGEGAHEVRSCAAFLIRGNNETRSFLGPSIP